MVLMIEEYIYTVIHGMVLWDTMVLMIDRIHLNCDTMVLMIDREYI